MTYHCGIGPGLQMLGLPARDPHISCDGCGKVHGVTSRSGVPYAWFLDSKSPPKWRTHRRMVDGAVHRTDYCPDCKGAHP